MFKVRIYQILLLFFGCSFCWPVPQASAGPKRDSNSATGKRILTITVVHGAVQNNMRQLPVTNGRGHQNWGCVKAASGDVWVMVTLSHNDAATINAVDWNGQGAPLAGYDNRYRRFGKDESKRYAVKPTLNGRGLREIYIWVIWATYEIRISGNLDQTHRNQDPANPYLEYLNNQWEWPASRGGGTALGPVDVCPHPSLTYAYALGRTQGVAYLTPSGVEQRVNKYSWKMRRQVSVKAYNNGTLSLNKSPASPDDHNDDSTWTLDTDPTNNPTGSPTNTIYDLDPPGCSTTLTGTAIDHTAESYANFNSWAAVLLDGEYRCSEFAEWSYRARVDEDIAATCKTTGNALYSSHIDITNPRFYDPR